MPEISADLVIAKPLVGCYGYTWTVASRTGHILHKAQMLFGNRTTDCNLIGFEFAEGRPHLWYPIFGNDRNVVVQLSTSSLTNPNRAFYQLAHECIHLLSAVPGTSANFLEEGLAEYFSKKYVKDEFSFDICSDIKAYEIASLMVERLLELDANAIKILREEQPIISQINKEQILKRYQTLSPKIAELLGSPFDESITASPSG